MEKALEKPRRIVIVKEIPVMQNRLFSHSNSARKSSSLPPSRSCAKELWGGRYPRCAVVVLTVLGTCVYKLQCLGAEVRRFYANTLSFQELFVELFIK